MFLDQQLETTHATTLSEFQLRRRDYKHWNSRYRLKLHPTAVPDRTLLAAVLDNNPIAVDYIYPASAMKLSITLLLLSDNIFKKVRFQICFSPLETFARVSNFIPCQGPRHS